MELYPWYCTSRLFVCRVLLYCSKLDASRAVTAIVALHYFWTGFSSWTCMHNHIYWYRVSAFSCDKFNCVNFWWTHKFISYKQKSFFKDMRTILIQHDSMVDWVSIWKRHVNIELLYEREASVLWGVFPDATDALSCSVKNQLHSQSINYVRQQNLRLSTRRLCNTCTAKKCGLL